MIKEFRDFLVRGTIVDLAVAIVIGTGFVVFAAAFSAAFIRPLVNLVLGGGARGGTVVVNGQTFDFGLFFSGAIVFLIVAAVVYLVCVSPKNSLVGQRQPGVAEAFTRECPECLSSIPTEARRCAFCTASVTPTGSST